MPHEEFIGTTFNGTDSSGTRIYGLSE